MVTHPFPHRHSLSAAYDQRARLAGAFSLALLCGCLKPCLKKGGRLDHRQASLLPLDPFATLTPLNPLVSQLASLWQMKKRKLSSIIIYLPFNSLPDKSPFQTLGHTKYFESQPVGAANPPLERANGKLENKLKQLGYAGYAPGYKKPKGGLEQRTIS